MKDNVAWMSRVLLLPLLPAIVGTVTRAVYSGYWSVESVDASELAFSLALIGTIVLSSVSRLSDKALRDSLTPVFIIMLSLGLCLFAGSILIRIVHEADQIELMNVLKQAQGKSPALGLLGAPDRCIRISGQIRTATLFITIFSLLVTAIARLRYALED